MSPSKKSEVVQMRLESALANQLAALAAEQQTPVSSMLRGWITDRARQELRRVSSERAVWRDCRLVEIGKMLPDDFADGPVLIVHGQPLTPNLSSDLAYSEKFGSNLLPLQRMLPIHGRINQQGYQATQRHHEKLVGKAQVFRAGQIETVQALPHDDLQLLGLPLNEAVVLIMSEQITFLQGQEIPLPYVFSIAILRVKDYWLVAQPSPLKAQHVGFQDDSILLPDVMLTDFGQSDGSQSLAQHVRPILEEIWNASGWSTLPDFDRTGKWHGPWR